jgi:hypothetical protein
MTPDTPVTEAQKETTLHTAGQRQINRIWEYTQAAIALAVSISALYVSARLTAIGSGTMAEGAFLLLSNAFFLVIGFYFGRTNHTRVGGIGVRDQGR